MFNNFLYELFISLFMFMYMYTVDNYVSLNKTQIVNTVIHLDLMEDIFRKTQINSTQFTSAVKNL